MGNSKSQTSDTPGGSRFSITEKKYCPESVKWTRYWIENWSFSPEGSFSMSEIRKLEEKVCEYENEITREKTMKFKYWEQLEECQEGIECWKKEIELSKRKVNTKQMPGRTDDNNLVCGRKDHLFLTKTESPFKPPPYHTDNTFPSSAAPLYPTLSDLAVPDPDLDSCPPRRLQQQQYQQLPDPPQASGPRQDETSSEK